MKELHNHIFSNTTCISKEVMLKYINKQLSKKELYEVEKHMLDCELCTDAFEGMKLATNSSMLFAIDSKIDIRSGGGSKKSPIIRNLMVAASVVIITFGAYFTINNFNKNRNQVELAIHENSEKELQPAPENFIEVEIINVENNQELLSSVEEIKDELNKAELNKAEQQKPLLINNNDQLEMINDDEVAEKNNTVSNNEVEIEEEVEEVIFFDDLAEEKTVSNKKEENAYDKNDNVAVTANAEGFRSAPIAQEANSKLKNKNSFTIRKKVNSAASAKLGNKTEASNQNTYLIYTYKVYDYSIEYQNDYDFKKDIELESVAPDFANEEDKGIAEKELEKSIIEVTYKETLKLGVKHLKENKYQLAINQFNLILKEHPKDVNALFYAGISQYQLMLYGNAYTNFNKTLKNKNKVFDQEAKWYKALSLLALKRDVEAKKILQEIINDAGFYQGQAKEKLKEIE